MSKYTTFTAEAFATENTLLKAIDPVHKDLGFAFPGLTYDIWSTKYRWKDEAAFDATALRVVMGIYEEEIAAGNFSHAVDAYHAMTAGLWMPAGRIIAGAGTSKRVTLMNCYVTGKIEDSMEGIMREHTNFALTMQQGGGDGADFSPIRPEGAILKRTGTKASGPLPFMHMWNGMCDTIRSAGDRRGAMMGVLNDTHPDLPKLITAKRVKGALTNFNISILVSDAFMEAIREDADWVLYFDVEPWEREPHLEEYDFTDDSGVYQFVYSVWKARDLWELITRNTYEYSEPGIIFIDRINQINNLNYCEEIRATNPCGEQPLPPHGACDLGHNNLARMVRNPFTDRASFDFDLLRYITRIGTRFLDNVINATNYPLPEQQAEQFSKRRIGLGFTGLADALAQLKIRYGSIKSAEMAEKIAEVIAIETYHTSVDLAIEKGAFPLFDAEKFLDSSTFAGSRLPQNLQDRIRKDGMRNGVCNTIAPTGTTSIVYGNPAGGLEPFFALYTTRKVLQPDGSYKAYTEYAYAARLYKFIHGAEAPLPSYMVTAEDLNIHEHILIQSRVQRWIDASISKTINIPEDMPYEEFVQVYELAYNAGCKGTTTYRPSDVRGSILTKGGEADTSTGGSDKSVAEPAPLRERPEVLNGRTYKIKWPNREAALYLTINSDDEGIPFEVFITSKDGSYSEWTTALSLMISAIFRKGGDIGFIPYELKQIQSMRDGAWINRKYVGSLPAYIGQLIENHLNGTEPPIDVVTDVKSIDSGPYVAAIAEPQAAGGICPKCYAPALYHLEGCKKCTSCGFSECG